MSRLPSSRAALLPLLGALMGLSAGGVLLFIAPSPWWGFAVLALTVILLGLGVWLLVETHGQDVALSQLEEERDLLRGVLEGMSESVIAIDRRGRVTLANRHAPELLGFPELPQGTPMAVFADIPRLRSTLVAALEGIATEKELVAPGPGARNLLVRAQPTTQGAVLVMLDITQLRRLEQTRRDLVENMSHELRTPTAIILSTTETLLRGVRDPGRQERFLGTILRASQRLTTMLDDLRELVQLDAGDHDLLCVPVEIGSLIEEACSCFEAMDHEVSAEIDEGLVIEADMDALSRILTNLLQNAHHYTPQGSPVVVRALRVGENARIEIRDTGLGVAEEHRDRLFERFYRVDKGRAREHGGTGLGLSIVRELTEAMGGTAGFEPNEPQGACFWVSFPLLDGVAVPTDEEP